MLVRVSSTRYSPIMSLGQGEQYPLWRRAFCTGLLALFILSGCAVQQNARQAAIDGAYHDAERLARTALADAIASQADDGASQADGWGTVLAHNQLGWQLLVQARFGEAGEEFRTTLRLAQDIPELKGAKPARLMDAILDKGWGGEAAQPDDKTLQLTGERAETLRKLARQMNASGLLYALGMRKPARAEAAGAAEAGTAGLSGDHPFTAVLLRNRAFHDFILGRLAEARKGLEASLSIQKKSLGVDSPHLGATIHALAIVARRQNDGSRAEQLYRQALALQEEGFSGDDAALNATRRDYAVLLREQNRLAEAETLMRRVLAADQARLGPSHPNIAVDLANLASLIRQLGRASEAEPMLRSALLIRENSLGPENPRTAAILVSLGNLYREQSRFPLAEKLLRRGYELTLLALGPTHPRTAIASTSLALVLEEDKRYVEAEKLYRRALAARVKRYGKTHSVTAAAMANLASALRFRRKFSEAEKLQRRALAITEQQRGPTHTQTAVMLSNLGGILRDSGRYDEARRQYRRALDITVAQYGENHRQTAKIRHNLAKLERLAGRAEHALGHIRTTTDILIRNRALAAQRTDSAAQAERRAATQSFADHADIVLLHEASSGWQPSQKLPEPALDEVLAAVQNGQSVEAATALARMAIRFAEGKGELAGVVRQRQAALDEFQRVDDDLLSSASADARDRNRDKEAQAIARLEVLSQQISQFDEVLHKEFPSYRQLTDPSPVTFVELQKLLKPKEALLSILPADKYSLVLAIGPGGVVLHRSTLGGKRIATLVRKLRSRLDPAKLHANAQLLELDLGASFTLYSELVGPIESALAGADHLIVVPDGALASLPFGVLLRTQATQQPTELSQYQQLDWLIRHYAISVMPSITSLRTLRQQAKRGGSSQGGFLGIGDPVLSEHPSGLRNASCTTQDQPGLLTLDGSVTRSGGGSSTADGVLVEDGVADGVLVEDGVADGVVVQADGVLVEDGVADGVVVQADGALVENGGVQADGALVENGGVQADGALVEDGVVVQADGALVENGGVQADGALVENGGVQADGALVEDGGVQADGALVENGGVQADGVLVEDGDDTPGPAYVETVSVLDWSKQRGASPSASSVYAGDQANVCAVSQLSSLPETAQELQSMAQFLSQHSEKSQRIVIGANAREAQLDELVWRDYRIIAFATHALVTGEIEGAAEPALVLTPPETASAADDGLLSASEIARLDLDADWVILSACNTAAPDGKPGAGALSGLARAFFYAGSRAMFVSHWAVVSTSTALLTTTMLGELAAHVDISRAEAHRRAILTLMNQEEHSEWSHPLFWAPFVIVGDGGPLPS